MEKEADLKIQPEEIRLFIGVDLNKNVLVQVEKLIDQFRDFPELRLTAPENYHLTLKFLGATPIPQISEVAQTIERIALTESPFSVTLKGIGIFPSWRSPRVLWVGVEDLANRMSSLSTKLEASLENLGFAREDRKYVPHLTIAKYRRGLGYNPKMRELFDSLEKQKINFGLSEIGEIVLYESCLGHEGTIYKPLARLKFGLNS